MTKSPLEEVLDQARDLIERGEGTRAELGEYLGVGPQQISMWLYQRTRQPNGNHSLKIMEWVSKKELGRARKTGKAIRAKRK